ncbi:hypothetical protein JKF63_07846 [Porcisia hertigi]|uniref:Uncharacterized protein n=1 Tax=Porcisia hertigi TaxID=2761500 RepID=A0A836LMJ3_9TRYP|nr:hypothetical protein JKF63_07846 [Porcisia hertigi]
MQAEAVCEVRGSQAALPVNRDATRSNDSLVSTSPHKPPQQQARHAGEDEERGTSRRTSPPFVAQRDAQPGTVSCSGGDAADRSPPSHRCDVYGALSDTEEPSSGVLHPPKQPQEASPPLPLLARMAELCAPQTIPSTSISAKQPSTAIGTDCSPPHLAGQTEDGAPAEPPRKAVASASAKATLTASSPSPRTWSSCAHSDLPARYRDTPGYYCTYCSYTVCSDCLSLTDLQDQQQQQQPSSSPSSSSSGASMSSEESEMDWLNAVIASPATAVRSGEAAGSAHEAATGTAATASASSGSRTTPLRCHLCRRGVLMREEALLHEWCCEGPAPAVRLHGGGGGGNNSFVYGTTNLHKYYLMRAQREARLSSTEPLLAQVLAVYPPATLDARDVSGGAEGSAPCVIQSPLQQRHSRRGAPRTVSDKKSAHGRDPLPSASPVHGQRLVRSHVGAPTNMAACSRNGTAHPLESCEEGGSFTFSVWNPRMEVQLVWCAVNREAREEAPASHDLCQHGNVGHCSGVLLPLSASITPLFVWCCPPSLPGLPARPFRVSVPYGLYAFANVHALALYMASDIFKKASTQLTTTAAGGNGDGHGAHNVRLSSVKVVPAATLRALLMVNVLHHVATTPVPLRLAGRRRLGLPLTAAASQTSHHHLGGPHPMQQQHPPSPNVAHRATPPPTSLKRSREREDGSGEGEDFRSSALPSAADLQWPRGLASTELALCVDHLLQGRSVAVYGIGSKFFFLHHVAQSAELKHLRVVVVDASLGRGLGDGSTTAATSMAGGDSQGAGPRGRRSGGSRGTNAPGGTAGTPSIVRQLITVGNTLMKRVRCTAATAEVPRQGDKAAAPRRQQETHELLVQKPPGAAGGGVTLPLKRAALVGEVARSPAMARDVTSAALQSASAPSQTAVLPVDVVDVDNSSSIRTSSSREESEGAGMLETLGTSRRDEAIGTATAPATKEMTTPSRSMLASRQHQRGPPSVTELMCTPSSQRGDTNLSSPATTLLPLMSPVPAFFEVLQRTVSGFLGDDSVTWTDAKDREGDEATPHCVCRELPEYAGGEPHLPKLPPLPLAASSQRGGDRVLEVTCRAPLMRFASDAVRQLAVKSVRRQQTSRRCVQWISLPSTTASAVLAEQMPHLAATRTPTSLHVPPRMYLAEAHALRPGWSPPLLLVLHNVDLLNTEEAGLLVELCAAFAYPYPHLQLLLSFDDPRWPLTPLASALERIGLCAVQLRSLLLPRVHEMQHVSSMRILADSEALAAGGAGSLGLKAMEGGRHGASAATGAGGLANTSASGSHLLYDTMRRVLFSLPQAFSGLLRILIDVQEEVGEGQKISIFVAKDRFEQHGMMVSQGRLKALLQELTSNRIAQYDAAEHALTVMQPRKLRTVLDEVVAQREAAAATAASSVSGLHN